MGKRNRTRQEKKAVRKRRRRRRILIIVLEVVLLLALGAAVFALNKLDKLDFAKLDEKKLNVYRDTGPYTNIALFGLDSREGEGVEGGVRSDSMMVASINNETGEVKIVSIFRDTLLRQENGEYDKANAAYFYGGAQEAVALLNRNLDLDIKNYMSVDFKALSDVIDALGGLEIELTDDEVVHMNNYCVETSKLTGKKYKKIMPETAGKYKLNGVQATSYARIRATEGGDYKRAERQRLVLDKIVKKAQKANVVTLNKIIDAVFPQVSTSFSAKELIGIASNALAYKLGETQGFPYSIAATDTVAGYTGSYVVPEHYSTDVRKLHQFLFDEEGYPVSDTVKEISSDIAWMSGVEADPEDYIEEASGDIGGYGGGYDSGGTDGTYADTYGRNLYETDDTSGAYAPETEDGVLTETESGSPAGGYGEQNE